MGCYHGRYVEVELKQPGRYNIPEDGLTPLQARHRAEIILNGGWHIVADDWSQVKESMDMLTMIVTGELGPGLPNGQKWQEPL